MAKKDNNSHPRIELFFELVGHHKSELITSNLITLLYVLPSLLLVVAYILLKGLIPFWVEEGTLSLVDSSGQVIATDWFLFQIRNVLFLALIFTNLLAFVGLSGLVYVVQKLCHRELFDEPLMKTFNTGIKRNFKHFIFASLIFSFACLFANIVISYYSFDLENILSIVCIAIGIVVIFFVSYLVFIYLPLENIYKGKFRINFKNALIIGAADIGRGVLFFLIAILPLAIFFVPNVIVDTIFLFAYLFIFLPYFTLIMVMSGDYFMDKFINKNNFPDLYMKGL